MGLLAILAGISTRIIFHFVEQEAIAPINLAFGVIPLLLLILFTIISRKSIIYSLIALFLVSGVYLNTLPINYKDSTILAYLHLPIFLWVLVGLAFTGNEYSKGGTRLAYIKFNLEYCLLYGSMAVSGMILAIFTMRLFSFVDLDIGEFYFSNVVLFGRPLSLL